MMNIDNRRLREIRLEKQVYKDQLEKSETISDSLLYQGKLESLEREEKDILARYDVII
jgi:hypothetical protein